MATQTLSQHSHSVLPPDVYNAVHDLSRVAVPVGRLCFAALFLMAVPMHFSSAGIHLASQQGVPMADVLVPLSGMMALLGGLSVLLGYHARIGALLLVLFLVPVTMTMHRFWDAGDANEAMMQRIMFLKNMSMLGGALMLTYFGAGPFSVDRHMETRRNTVA